MTPRAVAGSCTRRSFMGISFSVWILFIGGSCSRATSARAVFQGLAAILKSLQPSVNFISQTLWFNRFSKDCLLPLNNLRATCITKRKQSLAELSPRVASLEKFNWTEMNDSAQKIIRITKLSSIIKRVSLYLKLLIRIGHSRFSFAHWWISQNYRNVPRTFELLVKSNSTLMGQKVQVFHF